MVLKYNPKTKFKAKACSLGGLQTGGSGVPLWAALTALGASGSGRLRRLSGALDGSGRLSGASGRLSDPEEYGRTEQPGVAQE